MEMNSPCQQETAQQSDLPSIHRGHVTGSDPPPHTDLLGAKPDVPHMVADGLGGRHGAGQLPGLDDGRAALLHRLQEEEEKVLNGGSSSCFPEGEAASAHRDEPSFEPRLVLDGVVHGRLGAVQVDFGVVDIGVLGGGVVPPDDDVLHFVRGDATTHRHLQESSGHSVSWQ